MAVVRDRGQMIEPYVVKLENVNNTWQKKQFVELNHYPNRDV